MKQLRLFILLITATLCGCAYHTPFAQGNILTPAKIHAIHTGMTSAQVIATLGSPVLKTMYIDHRMSYVYTTQPTRTKTIVTRLIIRFHHDHVIAVSTQGP